MDTQVLVTGGAGFIGSHLATERIQHGDRVRALDALIPPVHGEDAARRAHQPAPAWVQVDVTAAVVYGLGRSPRGRHAAPERVVARGG